MAGNEAMVLFSTAWVKPFLKLCFPWQINASVDCVHRKQPIQHLRHCLLRPEVLHGTSHDNQ
jgi:hypothetical protein